MKRWINKNRTSILLFMAIGLVFAFASLAGASPLTALPFAGLAGAVAVRGPMEQLVTVLYTHTAATVKDTIYLLGGRVMLAVNSADANVENVFLTRGHIEYAKTTGETWVGGQLLYWDNSAGSFTTTVGTNTKAGYAMEAAASADTSGQVFLENAINL